MALQDTYGTSQPRFVVGMIPDMRTPGQDVSRIVETEAGIGFGKSAYQGTGDRQIAATGTSFIGVTVMDTTQLQDSYPRYSTARVRTKGPVVVTVSAAVVAGAAAYAADGAFSSAVAGDPIGLFETSADANGLAVLNLT